MGNFSQAMIGSLTLVDMVTLRQAATAIMRVDSCNRHRSKFFWSFIAHLRSSNNMSGSIPDSEVFESKTLTFQQLSPWIQLLQLAVAPVHFSRIQFPEHHTNATTRSIP